MIHSSKVLNKYKSHSYSVVLKVHLDWASQFPECLETMPLKTHRALVTNRHAVNSANPLKHIYNPFPRCAIFQNKTISRTIDSSSPNTCPFSFSNLFESFTSHFLFNNRMKTG